MKRMIAILGVFGLLMAFSLPATADVTVIATVDKDKDISVAIDVDIDKDLTLEVKQIVLPSNSAEALAIKNDVSDGNTLTETEVNRDGALFVGVEKTATIDLGAFDTATGIVNVNIAPGSMNNQGNADSVTYSQGEAPIAANPTFDPREDLYRFWGGAFLHAEASAEKILTNNNVTADGSIRQGLIDAAFLGISGIAGVNTAAGNLNNQNNAVALSVGLNSIAALAEADLGMTNSGNSSIENYTVTTDSISNGSFSGGAGIIGVNMSSGVLNNQANIVAASVNTHP
jgi:hypothetical protein